MTQQVQMQKQHIKRIDEAVREQEAQEHEEYLSKARRVSKRAARTSKLALSLLEEIYAYGV